MSEKVCLPSIQESDASLRHVTYISQVETMDTICFVFLFKERQQNTPRGDMESQKGYAFKCLNGMSPTTGSFQAQH